jgi:nucleoside-diphosphate-sugar epimerase
MIERRNFIGNASELKRTTKWQPLVSLKQGIGQMLDYYKINK